MAGNIKKDVKDRLRASRHWTAFLKFREELKNSGISPEDAKKQALAKFLPLSDAYHSSGGNQKTDSFTKTPAAKGVSKGRGRAADAGSSPAEFVIPENVLQKNADAVEVIEWVAKHLDVEFDQKCVDSAPCAEAVSMLRHYRNTTYRAEFWDRLYSRLVPTRAQLSHRSKIHDIDGKEILAIIEQIMNLKEEK